MGKRRKNKIDWFGDWPEWFGLKTYVMGWTVKSWKGVVAIGLVIFLIVMITMAAAKILTWI